MDIKDEIKARLPIDQLVAQYCQLKKKGRNFVSLCPFHNDTHPSFLISPDKGIAYCFACQSGGDIFSFIQKIENIDFPEAVKMLAEKAGVEIPKERAPRAPSVSRDEKQRLRDCLEAAKDFFVTKLHATPAAHQYVIGRGVTPELEAQFSVGYAPDSFSETYDALLKKGFSRAEIVASGLGVQRELKEERIYDRFRHRIMFPITDPQGVIVGFGGRAMGDSDAKYVNSPESPLYDKSSILFALFQARDAIRIARRVVLVEGYFDAIAAHKAGIKNVVAVSGTALTEQHVKIIKRYAEEVILCLDQDNAGQLAAGRAFDLLCKAQLKILSVTLPAKDPDELVQRDAAEFRRLILETPVPYIDAVIDRLKLLPDAREPTGKRTIAETLFPLLSAVPTSVELRAYLQKAARVFGVIEGELDADFRSFRTSNAAPRSIEKRALTDGLFTSHELTLGIALIYSSARPLLAEMIPLEDEGYETARKTIAQAAEETGIQDIISAVAVSDTLRERLKVVALYCEENFPVWTPGLAAKEMHKLTTSANRDVMTKKQVEIIRQLHEAKARNRPDDEARLLTQYLQLLKLGKMAS